MLKKKVISAVVVQGVSSLVMALLATVAVAPIARGQLWTLTRDQMIHYTAQNPFDRFPDGRPKVPDALLEKMRDMSMEEILGAPERGITMAGSGFTQQYSAGWRILNSGKGAMVGRAVTLQLMPLRPDVADVIQADRGEKGLGRISHQTAIDLLQANDVFVCDAFGSDDVGGIVGDNLAYAIWTTTHVGFVIDGPIRDLDGISEFGMNGYFRSAVPPAIRNIMVTGINVPVRIGHTTVMPGDVVVGDKEGVYFVPPALVQGLVDEAEFTHAHDEWTKKKFAEDGGGKYKSSDIYGSPKTPELIKEYDDFLKAKLGPERYAAFMKWQKEHARGGGGNGAGGGGGRGGQQP